MSKDALSDFNKNACDRYERRARDSYPNLLVAKPALANLKGPTLFCIKCRTDQPSKGCTKVKGTAFMVCAECKAK